MASLLGRQGSSSDVAGDGLRPSDVIIPYLITHAPVYEKLYEVQQRVWKSPKAEKHFQTQRSRADHADDKLARIFFQMMREIGKELHATTNAFQITAPGTHQPLILDMCAAPGGFLATALEINPKVQAMAFTLPLMAGGHRVLLGRHSRAKVKFKYLDITMLAGDMNMGDLPADHEEHGKFFSRQIPLHHRFRLVLCDGQVLRTQSRPGYREEREARRLILTQLALGLEHTEPGGTMVILLHKLEEWDTIMLLRIFHNFSTVVLFKPQAFHATRSSFYMVVSNICSESPLAVQAVAKWKEIWRIATFKGDEEYNDIIRADECDILSALDEFGPELVELGSDIWALQTKALEKRFL